MKKIIFTIALLIGGTGLFAQVAINKDGSEPDASAMFDVQSIDKGMLVPRMTASERDNISDPAKGLLIFCTDDNNFYMNKGTAGTPDWQVMSSQWLSNGSKLYYNSGKVGVGTANPQLDFQVSGRIGATYGNTSTPSFVFGDGSENTGFSSPSSKTIAIINNGTQSAHFDINGRMGLGTNNPNDAALLEISSTTCGFLPPRMSQTQRDAISSPPEGLMIFNNTTMSVNIYNGFFWMHPDNTPADAWHCGHMLHDGRDGKNYRTVQIGDQCWMAENLNYGTRIDGSQDQTDNNITEKYCYNDLESNCDVYGGMYQWDEVMAYQDTTLDPDQGICPYGWHVPTSDDWQELLYELGSDYTARGGHLKETGTSHWQSPNAGATNTTRFTALGAGRRTGSGFTQLKMYGYFWASESYSPFTAGLRRVDYDNAGYYMEINDITFGHSVRCIKN
mgnify:CR=1 FL=1